MIPRNPSLFRILIVCAGIISLAHGVYRFYSFSLVPTDENLFQDSAEGVEIVDIVEGGASDRAGLEVGDVILEINGQAFDDAFEADRILKKGSAGETLRYKILRDGRIRQVDVSLAEYGFEISLIALFLVMLSFAGFAVFVGFKRPGDPGARLLSSAFLMLSFVAFSGLGTSGPETLDEVVSACLFSIALPVGTALCAHAYLYFPVRNESLLAKRWRVRGPYVYFGVVAVFGLLIAFGLIGGIWSRMVVSGLYTLGLVGIGIVAFLHRREVSEQEKLKSVFIRYTGYAIFALFVVLSVATAFAEAQFVLYVQYALFVLILIPLSHLYTIFKFRLLDFNLVVKKNLVYAALSFSITLSFMFLILLGIRYLPSAKIVFPSFVVTEESLEITEFTVPEDSSLEKSLLMVLAVLMAALFWKLRKWIQQALDKKFYMESYDYRIVLSEFSELFASVLDRNELYRGIVTKLASIMNLKAVGIMLVRQGKLVPESSLGFAGKLWNELMFDVNRGWVIQLINEDTPVAIEKIDEQSKERLKALDAYFLAPIVVNEKILGVLVLGEKLSEDSYTVEDINFLHSVSQQTAIALENGRLYVELTEKERLENDLNMARKIQIGLLPRSFPKIAELDIAAACIPAVEVGGDYYDYFRAHDKEITLVVGDVSGKGSSAALYMSKMQGIMRSIYEYQPTTKEFFIKTNQLISREAERNFFVTMAGLRFDLTKRTVAIVRAGHLPILHYIAGKKRCESIQPDGIGLCLAENGLFDMHLEERKVKFGHHDFFVMVTDGITETSSPDGRDFDLTGVTDIIEQNPDASSVEIKDRIISGARSFSGSETQFDDFTVVVVKTRSTVTEKSKKELAI